MIIRRWARAVEKRCLRPLGRLLPRGGWVPGRHRIDRLEARVDELESLVRELTGLAYLRLDGPSSDRDRTASGAAPREAA